MSMSLRRIVMLVTPNAGLSAAFFHSAAPANWLAVFSRGAAGPQIHASLAMLLRAEQYAARNRCWQEK